VHAGWCYIKFVCLSRKKILIENRHFHLNGKEAHFLYTVTMKIFAVVANKGEF
jgi:hypothetical protein